MTEAAAATAKRLGLDRLGSSGEKLSFERLWQIKAAGINRERVRGREVVCRAIGAFRRYVGDLPVYGRASVVVELAGDEKIGGVGVDWRPIATEGPRSRQGARSRTRRRARSSPTSADALPGGEVSDKDFDVTMFSLGYISLPKRRAQGVFAPVYVAMLERRGWTTMNHVIVVNGSERGLREHRPIECVAAARDRETAGSRALVTKGDFDITSVSGSGRFALERHLINLPLATRDLADRLVAIATRGSCGENGTKCWTRRCKR